MSAGSFDSSNHDSDKRRIAHKGASSSAKLFLSLTNKRESIGKVLNNGNGKVSNTLKSSFVKRSKYFDLETEKFPKNKLATTFCGKSFMAAVTSQALQQNEPLQIKSDSEDSEPSWLSKQKMINGTFTKSGISIPKPPSTNYKVKRRAVLSSSEEDENNMIMILDISDQSNSDNNSLKKRKKPNKNDKKSRSNSRKAEILTESEENESDEEETENTPSSSDDDNLDSKKSLKELTAKARKLHNKRKINGTDFTELIGSDDENNDDTALHSDESFYSDDSDAPKHRNKKSLQKRKVLETTCLDFVNTASLEDLIRTEKFNERLAKQIVAKRPFEDFAELVTACSAIGRGTAMLDQYIDFLDNRNVLDQVLDDCKNQAEQIKAELKFLECEDSLNEQPKLLNSECILHPYQKVGLQWLIMMHKLGLNAILADEMGLGKTIQIISFLAWAKSQSNISHPHLIVVPSSTLENWMNEISKWCPSLRVLTYYGSIQERSQLRHKASTRNVDVILTTYNMVISRAEDRSFFKKFSINYVIYDEGHMLRSCNTMRYKNLMRVQGRRKILITGTPLQNNLVELISLLFFTMTKLFTKYCNNINMLLQMFARKGTSLHSGKRRNIQSHKKENVNNELNDNYNDDEIENIEIDDNAGKDVIDGPLYERYKIAQAKRILHPFVLRRLKSKVLFSLPEKHEKIITCDLTESQDELYVEILEEFKEAKKNGNSNALGFLMQMRQVANHPLLYRRNYDDNTINEMAKILCSQEIKYKGKNPEYVAEDLSYMSDITLHKLCRKFSSISKYELNNELSLDSGKCKQLDIILDEVLKKNEKILIFSQFTTILDILELYAENKNYKFCRLDGSTPVMERQDLINLFNTDSSINIFFLSTKAGGLGINLTAANNIIIHDIDLNPYNDKQAEDRCHRMGQTREVYVTRLISKNTVEESILELAQKKLELEKDVTSAHENNQKEELDIKTVENILSKAIEKKQK